MGYAEKRSDYWRGPAWASRSGSVPSGKQSKPQTMPRPKCALAFTETRHRVAPVCGLRQ